MSVIGEKTTSQSKYASQNVLLCLNSPDPDLVLVLFHLMNSDALDTFGYILDYCSKIDSSDSEPFVLLLIVSSVSLIPIHLSYCVNSACTVNLYENKIQLREFLSYFPPLNTCSSVSSYTSCLDTATHGLRR